LVGTGQANPLATINAVVMMLDYLGELEQSVKLDNIISGCITDGQVTQDLGGALSTDDVIEEILYRF